ncbi:hypothetical protein PHLCEN_2v3644 [Hermanssonia centrifuga]|uniref:Uncharacterized protein n=1 Tax=Hermanssonia centrifuga TaxID=98765 RepID=A0A2R6QET5_9APHY|nr:hypothetical protein PHLCEN_2v3644 [Hermanssonia centrifuga]
MSHACRDLLPTFILFSSPPTLPSPLTATRSSSSSSTPYPMPPRPSFTHKQRPLSAIYIGSLGSTSTASPPDLPRLPEPPDSNPGSPSGLPSPPATNSTGSGSNGDDSTNSGSVRKPRPFSTSDMYNGSRNWSPADSRNGGSSRTNFSDDEDDQNNRDIDEDDTARLNLLRRRSAARPAPADNMSALQRVKSLTERNRMVLDKLSSISRHGSPVPGSSAKAPTRSPFSPPNAPSSSTSAATSSRISTPSRLSSSRARPLSLQTQSQLPSTSSKLPEPAHSGSETERESTHTHTYTHSYSSSDSLSGTPTSAYAPPESIRPRRISAPSSPTKSSRRNEETARDPSPGPSRTPRKRASMAVSASDVRRDAGDEDEDRGALDEDEDRGALDERDVTAAALAAVASSRRSPSTASRRNPTRQPLPREFRELDRRSDGKKVSCFAIAASVVNNEMALQSEPSTPHHERFQSDRRSPSPSSSRRPPASTSTLPAPPTSIQRSPRRPTSTRYSTVRELTRKHQTRWLSEDLSASVDADAEDDVSGRSNVNPGSGRKQTQRFGSSESPFGPSGGRSLLGEGLRAAGLTKRRESNFKDGETGDVFSNGHEPYTPSNSFVIPPRRTRSTGASSVVNGQNGWEQQNQAGPSSRGIGESTRRETRTPAPQRNGVYATPTTRPGTSMAALHHETPSTVPPRSLRGYRSTYGLERQMSSSTVASEEVLDFPTPDHPHGRIQPSPFTPAHRSTAGESHSEHRKLMLDALSMFESHLSRLPPMGQTTTSTIPEVFHNSQTLVRSLDRLNDLLRGSTSRALEAQIEAEVEDLGGIKNGELVELWSSVGSEHREHLRLSDEIVRTMTQFLLGVGRVLREASAAPSARGVSIDEDFTRRPSPEVTSTGTTSDKRSSDGRQSRETRRSWDPRDSATSRALTRLASRERTSASGGSRPTSSTHPLTRSSAASSSEGRSIVDDNVERTYTPPTIRNSITLIPSSSNRRLYTPRDQRTASDPVTSPAGLTLMSSVDSQTTLHAYEPSPTPASRQGLQVHLRTRTLPPLAIPPSLPTLLSESLLNRDSTPGTDRSERRKFSTNSTATVRAEFPPVIKPPNTTTAVTTSPAEFGGNFSRTDSANSMRSNGVTFSRPSTISVSTLSGLQQQNSSQIIRQRSNSSTLEEPSPISVRSPMSGSETERPRTLGLRDRMSLDGPRPAIGSGSASRASTLTSRRERRRTITDIFAQAQA